MSFLLLRGNINLNNMKHFEIIEIEESKKGEEIKSIHHIFSKDDIRPFLKKKKWKSIIKVFIKN